METSFIKNLRSIKPFFDGEKFKKQCPEELPKGDR